MVATGRYSPTGSVGITVLNLAHVSHSTPYDWAATGSGTVPPGRGPGGAVAATGIIIISIISIIIIIIAIIIIILIIIKPDFLNAPHPNPKP